MDPYARKPDAITPAGSDEVGCPPRVRSCIRSVLLSIDPSRTTESSLGSSRPSGGQIIGKCASIEANHTAGRRSLLTLGPRCARRAIIPSKIPSSKGRGSSPIRPQMAPMNPPSSQLCGAESDSSTRQRRGAWRNIGDGSQARANAIRSGLRPLRRGVPRRSAGKRIRLKPATERDFRHSAVVVGVWICEETRASHSAPGAAR